MSQSVLSKGRDVIEAIEMGLKLLRTDRDQVSIEVIQQETKGFLKLGMKPAIVKITKMKQTSHIEEKNQEELIHESLEAAIKQLEPEKTVPDKTIGEILPIPPEKEAKDPLEGKVWIKDGVISGKPSVLQYPTITPGKGVEVYKNGELLTETALVTGADHFEIKTAEEITKTTWNITMDSQKLHVTLQVQPGMRKYYQIIDKEPDVHLVAEAKEITEVRNELEYKMVLEAMEVLKIVHGFNHTEIMNAINTEEPGNFTIASGIKPKDGKNGRLELIVDPNKKAGPQKRADGTIDYRENHVIPTVNKGQVIAIIHPPEPGVPGYNVSNEPIPPEQTYPLIVQTGKGTALIEDGQKVVATETGRPMVERKGLIARISIVPKLVHFSDVNISSGNIRFKGDVDILGSVEESMVVEADGHINIFHNANKATISSKSSIILQRNSIGSTISAGKHNVFVSEMVHQLILIHDQFTRLISSINHLMTLPAFKMTDFQSKGLLPIIKLLLEQKFRSILTPLKQFLEIGRQGKHVLDLEWMTMAEQLRLCLMSSIANEYHSMNRLEELADRMIELIDRHQNLKEDECMVSLMYAINSTIYSGGNVSVLGQGCYNSKIHAGGAIKIAGVLRGGEVYARKGASIRETGSDGGAVTKIIVPANQKISIDHVKEGTVIQIGKVKHSFQSEYKHIAARLDETGRLIF
ncbi:flagellar assembly protein A [Cytobacillus firmus]|uniref:RNA-binding protein KhpB N-terminal domain-containing protein n=1 Tax=Cytobacillus firmus DS1 TaxID=1307436 RepID=W7KZK7_CYTFI|nr:flagellar assembly protein A [Cytobacillus firmus]EWG11548.1 hypothetical protein PBF_08348 [Cytobacillus firmus DS1]